MIHNMDEWVRGTAAPPESRYPKIADGTLVPPPQYAFPSIPGVQRAHEANEAWRLDFGAHWRDGVLSLQPPKLGVPFPVLVPQVDEDGNERAGVRLPEITVPLATYAAWNLRDASIGAPDQRVSFEGSYLPFAKSADERKRTADPRRAIAERYRGREEYRKKYGEALDDLIRHRYILEVDRVALMQLGEQEWNLATK